MMGHVQLGNAQWRTTKEYLWWEEDDKISRTARYKERQGIRNNLGYTRGTHADSVDVSFRRRHGRHASSNSHADRCAGRNGAREGVDAEPGRQGAARPRGTPNKGEVRVADAAVAQQYTLTRADVDRDLCALDVDLWRLHAAHAMISRLQFI